VVSRPLGVSAVAVVSMLSGVSSLISALILMVTGSLYLLVPTVPLLTLMGLGLVPGLIYISIGIGLLRLKVWAWWLAIILTATSLASYPLGLVWISATPGLLLFPVLIIVGIVSVILNFLTFIYLVMRRRVFGNVLNISKPLFALLMVLAITPSVAGIWGSATIPSFIPPWVSPLKEVILPEVQDLAVVNGKVSDEEGNPLTAYLYFSKLGEIQGTRAITYPAAFTVTENLGSFMIRIPKGKYFIEAYSEGYLPTEVDIEVNGTVNVEIVLTKLQLTTFPLFAVKDIYDRDLTLLNLTGRMAIINFYGPTSIPIRWRLHYLYGLTKSFGENITVVIFKVREADNTPDLLAREDYLAWIVVDESYSQRVRSTSTPIAVLNEEGRPILTYRAYNYLYKLANNHVYRNSLPNMVGMEQMAVEASPKLKVGVHNPGSPLTLSIKVESMRYNFQLMTLETASFFTIDFISPQGFIEVDVDLKKASAGTTLLTLMRGHEVLDQELVHLGVSV